MTIRIVKNQETATSSRSLLLPLNRFTPHPHNNNSNKSSGGCNRNNNPSFFLQPQRGYRFSLLELFSLLVLLALVLNVTLWLVHTNVGMKNFLFGPAAVNIQQQKQKQQQKQRRDDTDTRVIVKGKETFIVHSTTTTNVNTTSSSHIVEGNKTYGIIHVAKTGGTALNERMARTYERVCGNKGASFQKWKGTRLGKRFDLWKAMDGIGYLDCDVIITEKPWTFWKDRFSDWFFQVELHVPCRDPIEQVMSRCHMNKIQFQCPSMELSDNEFNKQLLSSLEECYMGLNGNKDYRVSFKLKEIPNFQLKCFDYKQEFTKYWEYMDVRLQRRRIETLPTYVNPEWGSRNRSAECVWRGLGEGIAFRNRMKKFMIEEHPDDTWRFCETCLGSQDDLLAVV